MAVLQVTLMSQSLMRTVPVTVILAVDKLRWPGMPVREDKPYKTLYLLHGIFGSSNDWLFGTRIQRYAEEHDLAVVMPSGDNAFYVDQPAMNNYYGQFIGQELVELTRKMLPLSHKREDTYIGGLSMGGYGAMRNGLKYTDTFGAIVSLSGALTVKEMAARTQDTGFMLTNKSYAEACFGDLTKLLGSDMDPWQLVKDCKNLPEIYMACGTEDSLLRENDEMAAHLKAQGARFTYETWAGGHDWDFWDTGIKKAIQWLPTEEKNQSVHSGNVVSADQV